MNYLPVGYDEHLQQLTTMPMTHHHVNNQSPLSLVDIVRLSQLEELAEGQSSVCYHGSYSSELQTNDQVKCCEPFKVKLG